MFDYQSVSLRCIYISLQHTYGHAEQQRLEIQSVSAAAIHASILEGKCLHC